MTPHEALQVLSTFIVDNAPGTEPPLQAIEAWDTLKNVVDGAPVTLELVCKII